MSWTLTVLQHNCRRSGEAVQAVLETGIKLGADIVLIQEPPLVSEAQYRQRHPGFRVEWEARTATAIRVDTRWKTRIRKDLSTQSEGYIQIIECSRKNQPDLRIVNIYDQVQQTTRRRPAREEDWGRILTDGTVLAGDFNAHSARWNDICHTERDATWIKHLMDSHDLRYSGDRVQTCSSPNSNLYSVIDLVFSTNDIAQRVRADTLVSDEHTTGSDHRIIRWRLEGRSSEESTVARGWSTKEMCKPLSQSERDEGKKNGEELAGEDWKRRVGHRPLLDEQSTPQDIDNEAAFIRTQLHTTLDAYAKPVRITARSKRWWNDEIGEQRKALGQAIHRYRMETGTYEQVKQARRKLAGKIRHAKRTCWEEFLQNARGHEVGT
jgi:endonuclease/exonuclease/phosphatase family metal-dependent hydrolase